MTVRFHLRRMRVVSVDVDEPDLLVVRVMDLRSVVRCPECRFRTSTVHETKKVKVRDVPQGRPTRLIWLRRRFCCENCEGRFTTPRSKAT